MQVWQKSISALTRVQRRYQSWHQLSEVSISLTPVQFSPNISSDKLILYQSWHQFREVNISHDTSSKRSLSAQTPVQISPDTGSEKSMPVVLTPLEDKSISAWHQLKRSRYQSRHQSTGQKSIKRETLLQTTKQHPNIIHDGTTM